MILFAKFNQNNLGQSDMHMMIIFGIIFDLDLCFFRELWRCLNWLSKRWP